MFFLDNRQKLENESKDTFVASIVHDLKNPLIAHSRILENIIPKSNDEFIKTNCREMLSSMRLLLEMVMSITNTYKYSDGKIKYNFQAVNIVDITNQICRELSFLTENEVKIGKFFNSRTEFVKADAIHIRRVISNLISNAIKYKKEGTPITVELSVSENSCVFAVTNSGNYIKPELQKEIFQKYVSKTNKFNSLGTGLGLYLSKKIIEDHKGKIFVNSTPEGINTFGFKIPNKVKVFENSCVN